MLCGEPPFTSEKVDLDERDEELDQLVLKGKFSYPELELSSAAKSFISNLLSPDPEQRMTAQDALEHDFFVENYSSAFSHSPGLASRALNHLDYRRDSRNPGSRTGSRNPGSRNPSRNPGSRTGSRNPSRNAERNTMNTERSREFNSESLERHHSSSTITSTVLEEES